jgi:predicted ABC-type ATPase
VVATRYIRGMKNFFQIFKDLVDQWIFIDNSGKQFQMVATGSKKVEEIRDKYIWKKFKQVVQGS